MDEEGTVGQRGGLPSRGEGSLALGLMEDREPHRYEERRALQAAGAQPPKQDDRRGSWASP